MTQLQTWYDQFDAQPGAINDSEERCAATLYWHEGNKRMWHSIGGKTGTQYCSHAEMNALHEFLGMIDWPTNANIFWAYDLEIECTSKPCCRQCSAVLGLLRIRPRGGTTKSLGNNRAGWGLSNNMKQFLARLLEVNEVKLTRDLEIS